MSPLVRCLASSTGNLTLFPGSAVDCFLLRYFPDHHVEPGALTLEEVNYIAQILSTIALVISVIYLGRQTHLAGEHQISQMHQARSYQFQEYTLKLTDAEFGPIARAAFRADDSLDDEQVMRFYFYASTMLRFFEEIYRQWQEGVIASGRWQTTKRSLNGILLAPGFRAVYSVLRCTLDRGFVATVDSLIETSRGRLEIDPVAEWRAAVAEEMAATFGRQNQP